VLYFSYYWNQYCRLQRAKDKVRDKWIVSALATKTNSTLEFYVDIRLSGYFIYPWNLSRHLRFISVLPIIHNTGLQLFDNEKLVNIQVRYLPVLEQLYYLIVKTKQQYIIHDDDDDDDDENDDDR